MMTDITSKRKNLSYRILSCFIAVSFISNVVLPPGYAQLAPQTVLNLPAPGTMVSTTAGFTPVLVKGITIHPENPLQFDFIVDPGQSGLAGEQLRGESTRLIKYFLASLTVPEDQLWVNLSPYEKDRITGTSLGATEMGRDMLAQDYILKQLMASLMYPEKELGKKFWDGVYKKAQEQFGTTQIPTDTFNKVWIVPDKAVVYQHGNSAFVVENSLKVMLEQDYQAMSHNVTMSQSHKDGSGDVVTTDIIREVIIPALTKEVNEGQTFAQLRQIYNSMILAAWYKQNLRESLLGRVYVNQAKTRGVDVADKKINEKIYQQYLEAFKKGVYNYIREDRDPVTRDIIPRKYFSGGVNAAQLFRPKEGIKIVSSPVQLSSRQRQSLPAARVVEIKTDLVEHTPKNQDYVAQAVARSGAGASSPISQNVRNLLDQSEDLMDRMSLALSPGGDRADLETALEQARVDLPGSPESRPFLFAIGKVPLSVDLETLTMQDIQRRLGDEINITEQEAAQLKNRQPFSFATKEQSERNGLIYDAALKKGLLGVRYIATNIKKFSENSHLAYMEFLKKIVEEYNGYVTVLLSVEQSDKVLLGDGAGMATMMQAIEKKLGQEFLQTAQIDIITDGGLKTRGGNWTGKYGYNGVMPTPYGVPYYTRAMNTLGKVRLQHQGFGENRIYWTASDGDYDIGELTYGIYKESQLQDDGGWSMIVHGKEELVLEKDQMDHVFSILPEVEKNIAGKKDWQDPIMQKVFNNIRENKLSDLGENFSDPSTGKMVNFKEKPGTIEILEMLKQYNTNRIIPNAFLVVYTRDAFLKQIQHYQTLTSEGKRLAEYKGSYFQAVVQAQFDGPKDPKTLAKLPAPTRQAFADLANEALPKDKIIAASLGAAGRFRDRGNTDLLSRAYSEKIEELRKSGIRGRIEKGSQISEKVTVNIPKGAVAVLENVRISADQPVTLTLKNGVYIQNSVLKLKGDTTFEENTIIVDSDIDRPLDIKGGNTVLLGMTFKENSVLWDFSPLGGWESINRLEIYSGETITSILNTNGMRYVNRTLTDAPYKFDPEKKTGVLQDIVKGDFNGAKQKHPRLMGISGISDETVASNTDLLTMKNWRAPDGTNADITKAKESMDFINTYRELSANKASSSPVAKSPGVPGSDEDRAMIENSQTPGALPSNGRLPDLPSNGGKATRSSTDDIVGDVSKVPASSPVTTVVTEGLLVGIHKAIESLRDQDLRGVRVMVRANLNVPINDKGEIEDTTRIVELFPLLDFLKEKDAIVILIGHKGRDNDRVSVKPVRNIIANRYPGVPVSFYDESITADGLHVTRDSLEIPKGREREAGFHILDNVRFALDYEQGEKGSPQREKFGKDLANIADIFIFEAAGDLASEGASVEDLPRHFAEEGGEVFVGPATIKETEMLDPVVRDGIDAIIFGGKKEDKVGPLVAIMKNLSSKIQFVLLGSSSSNAITEGNVLLKKLSETYPDKIVEAKDYDSPATTNDIGDKTIALYLQKLDTLRAGQTVLVNGTMGWVEEEYRKGTEKVFTKLKELAQRGVRIVVIGGDGSSNARRYGLDQQPNVYLFTGGGVQLKRLAGKKLVGVVALQQAYAPGIAAKARKGGLLRLITRKLRLESNRNGGKVLQDTITSLQAFKESFLDQIETIEQNLEKAASQERKREVMAVSAQRRSQILKLADDLIEGQKLLAGEDVTVLSEQGEEAGQIDRKIAEELGYSFTSASSPVTEGRQKPKIVLAEDNEDIRLALTDLLEAQGYEVIAVSNGGEALERMTADVKMVVTNFQMPGMDGATLIREIRKGPGKDIPVIMLSATPRDKINVPGDVTVLPKPVPRLELLDLMAEKIKSSSPVKLEMISWLLDEIKRQESTPADERVIRNGRYTSVLTVGEIAGKWARDSSVDTVLRSLEELGANVLERTDEGGWRISLPDKDALLKARGQPKRILVVDTRNGSNLAPDNSPARILERRVNGYIILPVSSVEEGLEKLKNERVDLLVTDVKEAEEIGLSYPQFPTIVSLNGKSPEEVKGVKVVGAYPRGFIEQSLVGEVERFFKGKGVSSSPAAEGKQAPGGIDLNPALLDLQIKRDANFVPLPLPQQPLQQMHIEGFIPVIINITPVTNLPMLLGLADTEQNTDDAAKPDLKARDVEEISALN